MFKTGFRCNVCTGCGRCQGGKRKLHVVTEHLKKEKVDLHNSEHLRLITVDVGTTTIAMQLHGDDGTVEDTFVSINPQIKYGVDVLSRIAAAEKPGVAHEMREMVLMTLQKGMVQFKKRLAVEEKPVMVVAANTTMVYFLMGWDTRELGRAPFSASHLMQVETELAGEKCYIFPGLSAFVGGDIVAGIHACGMLKRESPTLLIDLGTNGEIVLGSSTKLYACATAAGPAFEGGVNCGVWGADMVSLIAEMLRKKLLNENGLLADKYFDTGVRIGDVCVTQESVRAIQLAKAAVFAGITILCEQYGCALTDIDNVVLAGGFGYYLNPCDAATIGLLPRELVGKTVTGGNTALVGALYIGEDLIRGGDFEEATVLCKKETFKLTIINLAEISSFQEKYFCAINF